VFDLLFLSAGVVLLAMCLYLNRHRWTGDFHSWLLFRALPLTIFLLLMLAIFWITWARFLR